jgi:hypothetical protein
MDSSNLKMTTDNPKPESDTSIPTDQADPTIGRNLGQILIILVVLLVLVNIPFGYLGLGLAQLMPDPQPVVLQNGMLLQGSGPKIYLLEDHRLRWISSPESFKHYFRDHGQVKLIEDSLLAQFGQGSPIRHLVKCRDLPYLYALENGQKRWVKNPNLTAQTKPWDQIHPVSCAYLSSLPTGPPISEHAVRTFQDPGRKVRLLAQVSLLAGVFPNDILGHHPIWP